MEELEILFEPKPAPSIKLPSMWFRGVTIDFEVPEKQETSKLRLDLEDLDVDSIQDILNVFAKEWKKIKTDETIRPTKRYNEEGSK